MQQRLSAMFHQRISPSRSFLEEDPELSRLRGTLQADEEVGRLTSWITRKDYDTLVGIALPIQDCV
jgi:hypothetical protein